MTENEIAKQILDAAFLVHTKLGPGLLESVYEVVMAYELKKRGLTAERQKAMPIMYDNVRFDEAFRSDIVLNGKVIAELKSVEALLPVHAKQVPHAVPAERIKAWTPYQFRRSTPEGRNKANH
jgi:GxxExxY protein